MNDRSKKIIKISSIILLIVLIVAFCMAYFNKAKNTNYVEIDTESTKLNVEYTSEELSGEWEDYAAKITLSDSKTTIDGKRSYK